MKQDVSDRSRDVRRALAAGNSLHRVCGPWSTRAWGWVERRSACAGRHSGSKPVV